MSWQFSLILFPFLLLCTVSCKNVNSDNIQNEIDRIARKWVPDSRIAICNAELKTLRNSIILKGETTIPDAKNDLINALSKLNIKLIDSLLILPDTSVNNECYGVVALSVINLRKDHDHSAELVSQAILGTPVLILKRYNSWLQVQTPDSYISWTESSSIVPMDRTGFSKWKKADKVIFLESTGWLNEKASDESGVISDVVGGCTFKKTGELKDWLSVLLPDGRKGFVQKKKVADYDSWKDSVQCTQESIFRTALKYLGIPYLWGGTSYKGADCSGFVESVFFQNGLILQRDASLQALHGTDINISDGYNELRQGDLLFFGSKSNGKPRVTHVAIYIGNNEYINASGRVMINSLDSSKENYLDYRNNSLLLARRIIGVYDAGIVPLVKHSWY